MNTKEIQEQIQEDIISYFDHPARERHVNPTGNVSVDELCQIVVDNFKELDDKPNESIERHQATQQFFNDTYDMGGY